MNFAQKFKQLRQESRLSRDKIAGMLGVSFSAVRSWEDGTRKPTIDRMCRIAHFFGVDPNELLCWDEYMAVIDGGGEG